MIDLIVLLVGLGIIVCINYWGREILTAIEDKQLELEQKLEPQVTYTHPALVNPNAVGQGDSVIIEPKSPQLVQWEEEEQVRKLNLKPSK